MHKHCAIILESLITKLNTTQDINPNFRLWLTTLPTLLMPNSVLGDSIETMQEEETPGICIPAERALG